MNCNIFKELVRVKDTCGEKKEEQKEKRYIAEISSYHVTDSTDEEYVA